MKQQPAQPSWNTGSFINPQALMTIKNLELRAKIVVEGFWNGLHRSPYHGFSVEFTEYRQYTPGDDPRYLDWRLYARSDRYYIKKYEDETNLRCHLIVDNSKSMHFGSLTYTKSQYAATLAATLAQFLHGQGDAVGLLTFDEQLRDYLPARHRTGHLRHLMLALEKPGAGMATDLGSPLRRIAEISTKRGLMVFITDLLAPLETLEANLAALGSCGHDVVLFHLLDPVERTFNFPKESIFYDVETARELYIDPVAARAEYQRKLEAHLTVAQTICDKLGMRYLPIETDRPLETVLFDFLRERMARGKKVKQRGQNRGSRSGTPA